MEIDSKLPIRIDDLPTLTVVKSRGVVDPKVVLKATGSTAGCIVHGGIFGLGGCLGLAVWFGLLILGPTIGVSAESAGTAGLIAAGIGAVASIVAAFFFFLSLEPVILAPEAALRQRMDWNWLWRNVIICLGYVVWLGSYFLFPVWSAIGVPDWLMIILLLAFPIAAGVGIGALGRHLFSEDKDRRQASSGEQMKGYRLICMMNASEYERKCRQQGMPDNEVAYALGQHLEADNCEITDSKHPNTKLVIFRWREHPRQAVQDRLKRIPSQYLSGRKLRLLLFGKDEGGRSALPS